MTQILGGNMKREDCYYEYAKNLEGEYKEAYKTVDKMLSFMSGGLNPLGSIMSEVVDLLIVAQEENRPVSSVLGDDLYAFCCEILKGNKISVKEIAIRFFIRIRIFVILNLLWCFGYVIFQVEEAGILLPELWLLTSPILMIFKYILSYALRPLGKYVGRVRNILISLKVIIELVIIWQLCYILLENPLLIQLSQLIPLKIKIGILSILLCWTLWISNQRKKKYSKDEEIKFSDLVFGEGVKFSDYVFDNGDFLQSLLKEEQKLYVKYLKKCKKKGKVPMGIALWYDQELKKSKFYSKWGGLIYGAFAIELAIFGIIVFEFETGIHLLIYIVAQVIVQLFIGGIFICICKKSHKWKKQIQERMIETNSQEQ